jgi:hypothetical protein
MDWIARGLIRLAPFESIDAGIVQLLGCQKGWLA